MLGGPQMDLHPFGESPSYGRDESRPYKRASSISTLFHPEERRPPQTDIKKLSMYPLLFEEAL